MDILKTSELLGTRLILECNTWSYAYVSKLFAMYCNATARGPKFRWDQFADMVADGAPAFVGSAITWRYESKPKKSKAIEEYVTYTSRIWAESMVKMAGFVEE